MVTKVKKHTIHLKVRRIDNGYIVTGRVENRIGSAKFPESFVPSLAALDMAVSERFAGAEVLVDEIKRPEPAESYSSMWSLYMPRQSDDDEDEDDD